MSVKPTNCSTQMSRKIRKVRYAGAPQTHRRAGAKNHTWVNPWGRVMRVGLPRKCRATGLTVRMPDDVWKFFSRFWKGVYGPSWFSRIVQGPYAFLSLGWLPGEYRADDIKGSLNRRFNREAAQAVRMMREIQRIGPAAFAAQKIRETEELEREGKLFPGTAERIRRECPIQPLVLH